MKWVSDIAATLSVDGKRLKSTGLSTGVKITGERSKLDARLKIGEGFIVWKE